MAALTIEQAVITFQLPRYLTVIYEHWQSCELVCDLELSK